MNEWLKKLVKTKEFMEWKFEMLSIDDKPIYDDFIKLTEYPANVWASNFDYLWAYTNSRHLFVYKALVNKMLVTFILTDKGRLYMPCLPYGTGDPKRIERVLLKCVKFCVNWNKESKYAHKSVVNPINEAQLEYLKTLPNYEDFFYVEKLSGLERHFLIQNLLELKGKEFKYVRRKINQFHNKFPDAILRKYKNEDYDQIMKLGEIWEQSAGTKYRKIIDGFYFGPIIKNSQKLKHLVYVVEIKQKIIGMISGGVLPTGESWWCLSKFNNEYDGLSEFLGVELAKVIHETNPEVKYMNAGSDLGYEGLAFYKERFRPVFNYKRYALFFKN